MGQLISLFRAIFDGFTNRFPGTPEEPPPNTLKKYYKGPDDRNPLMFQFFHWDAKGNRSKSWWQIFEESLPELEKLGVTQVWLPPPNKAMHPEGRGYDAYDLWDLGEFRQKGAVTTRWGTKEQLLSAIRAAKGRNIEVLVDAVLNHKLGADKKEKVKAIEVDAMNRNREIGSVTDIEAWTRFDFNGRGGKYSKMTWNSDHFTGIDWDSRRRRNAVFRFTGPGKHEGWSTRVDNELGNYDYLLGADIDHRHEEVQEDYKKWGPWVLETLGTRGGFRLDAIKHMDYQFLAEWLHHTREQTSHDDLFAVGEYWTSNVTLLRQRMKLFNGELSFFDVPLHSTFHDASKAGSAFDLRRLSLNSLVKYCPDDAVTFVDNHDTVIGQSLQSWVTSKFKPLAYAYILLRPEGYPCVFYNDLYIPDQPNVAKVLRRLMLARRYAAYGAVKDYFNHRNCIAWVRAGNEEYPEGCVVILNNSDSSHQVQIQFDKTKEGYLYFNVIDPKQPVSLNDRMRGTFPCDKWTVAVYVPKQNPYRQEIMA